MEVRKFRAATTREALEKIKQEMGEDAFVLEAKQVRGKGILGFGTETQVEVSAAAAVLKAENKNLKNLKTAAKNFFGWTDNAPAVPASYAAPGIPAAPNSAIAGLHNNKLQTPAQTTRHAHHAATFSPFAAEISADYGDNELPRESASAVETAASSAREESSRGVEITNEAPRIVHTKTGKKAVAAPDAGTNSLSSVASSASAHNASEAHSPQQSMLLNQEFERLRAELREVKFTLNNYTSGQSALIEWFNRTSAAATQSYETPFDDAYLELLLTGLSEETARKIIASIAETDGSQFSSPSEAAHRALLQALPAQIRFLEDPLHRDEQVVLAMVGSTGVGKTTTLAKLAARIALRERRRVELITLDTYRIAAVEQLKTYAEIIGANFHIARSTLELDAIISRVSNEAAVLIDTTGRSPHDLSDQSNLSTYLRERQDIIKCLALQATMHEDDAVLAAKKFAMYGINCLALTKLDESSRVGAAVQIAAQTMLPLAYLCSGQRVPEDLEQASAEAFAARLFPLTDS